MKPVTQSKVGAHGRCFPACVASILEVPEASVPGYEDSPDVYQWLAKRGLEYRQVPIEDRPAPVGYHIIEGISPRGGQHAVVGLNGKIVHDPHPQDNTGRGLVKPERWGMLLPLRGRAKDEDKVAYVIYRPPGSNAGVVEVNGQKYYIDATHRLVDAGYKLDNAKRLSTNDFGKKSTGEVQRWMRGYPVHPLSGEKAKDSMLSGLALQAAITPVYTRHNEIKATPRRSWQEVSRLLGETKALLDASRISDKAKWQTVLAHASSFLAMARDAERQGDNPHFVGWTERAFMMTHHVLDVLESLARRTTARDAGHYTSAKMAVIDVLRSIGLRWARDDGGTSIYRQKMWKVGKEPSTDEPDLERLVKVNQRGEWEIATWRGGAFVGSAHGKGADRFKMLGARAEDADSFPYKPGALIKLPNGKITEVTKCLLGKNLFHEPEYHVSTKTGECVVVPVKTKAKDKGPCLTCGKPTPSDEHFCSATCEETWLAKKYPREWADMKRRGGKLEDNLPKPVAVNDADFKVGDHVTIEAGYGGKGGKMPEDFYRFGKDTPAVLTNVVSGGNVYVKVEGFPYNFKMPARALKGCANDAKRARLHRALDAVVVPVKTKAKDLALPDDDEGAIYTCITKDGVKHEIEALTARHANSIAEKRYGYANISVCPQESLKKRATDSPRKAPARLHRALDAVMDRVKAKDEERKIARWESKTGKYWVDLYFNPAFKLANGQTVVDAHYRGDSSGGGIQASTEAEAITAMQQRIDRGGFQPDASKTPMRRVK